MISKFTSLHKIFPVIILLFYALSVSAQYDDLQKDKNITWMAEFFHDHSFALNKSSSNDLIKLIKFEGDASNFSNNNTSNWVVNWIHSGIKSNEFDFFKDANLSKALTAEEVDGLVAKIDTVTTFNTDTYQEMIQIIKVELSSNDIQGLRVKQIIYYDQKQKNFNTRVVAIAPLVMEAAWKNEKSKSSTNSDYPLLWIKMDGKLPKKFKVKSSEINWAALVFSSKNPINLNEVKEVKISDGFDVKNRIYQQAIDFEKPITLSFDGNEKLTREELNSIYTSKDTVITFSPDTYEEMVKIVENEIKPEDISNIRIVQEWYFDQEKNRLMNQLKAICLMTNVKDKRGKIKYWRSLYFIKYD